MKTRDKCREGGDFGGDEWNGSMLSGFGFLQILSTPINLKFAHIYPFSSFGPFSWLLILFKLFEVAFGNTQWRKVENILMITQLYGVVVVVI